MASRFSGVVEALAIQFDDHLLDPVRRELSCSGSLVEVEPRVFDRLLYLIENRQRVVSKDDLIAHIWGGRIVSDSAVTHAINAARRAIGDDGKEQRLIRTSSRKGYRFVGRLRESVQRNGTPVIEGPSPGDFPLALPERPSIAVLPFVNIGGNPEQEYFADGLVEDIIVALTRFKPLFVIARNSSFTYKGRAIDVRQVGRDLGVRYVLEGTIRKVGDRVRITGQLVDASSGSSIWADRMDGVLQDSLEMQDVIAGAIASKISPKIQQAEIERARRKPVDSLDAYDYFLRSLASTSERTRESFEEALRLSYKAIDLDSSFSTPYGIATRCYSERKSFAWGTNQERESQETRRLASRVWEIGNDDGVALAYAGRAMGFVCRDYDSAAAMTDEAFVANPNLVQAWICGGQVNTYRGLHAKGIAQIQEVLRISPVDPERYLFESYLGYAYALHGMYDESIAWSSRALLRQPNAIPALRANAIAQALSGNRQGARRAMARLRQIAPSVTTLSYHVSMLPYSRKEDIERFTEGFRIAGLRD